MKKTPQELEAARQARRKLKADLKTGSFAKLDRPAESPHGGTAGVPSADGGRRILATPTEDPPFEAQEQEDPFDKHEEDA